MEQQDGRERVEMQCAYCAHKGKDVRYHSGIPECTQCWGWRKLDAPAAHYWNDRIAALFEQGPDLHDWATWREWGMEEEVNKALHTLAAVRQAYDAQIEHEKARRAGKEVDSNV